MRRRWIETAVMALVFLVLVVHYDAVGPRDTEVLSGIVRAYVRDAPGDEDEEARFGPVSAARCREFEGRYRGEPMFLCDVEYERRVTTFVCVAIVDGVLYTHDQARGLLPCVPRVGVPVVP